MADNRIDPLYNYEGGINGCRVKGPDIDVFIPDNKTSHGIATILSKMIQMNIDILEELKAMREELKALKDKK